MANKVNSAPTTPTDVSVESGENGCEEKCQSCVNVIWGRCTTTLGLFLCLIAYSFFGAGVMLGIEGHHAEQRREERTERGYVPGDRFLEHFVNGSEGGNLTEGMGGVERVRLLLEEYERQRLANEEMANIHDHNYWEWMLFCLTVYTTIGYGSIYPISRVGRIASMFYATFGVPLFLLTMGKLGQVFTRYVKRVWSYVRKCYYHERLRPLRKSKPCHALFGKKDKKHPAKSPTSPQPKSPSSPQPSAKSPTSSQTPNQLAVETPIDRTDTTSYVSYEVDAEFDLHPLVAIMVTLIYILLGALMYVQWEEDWAYHDAFYFIFISISTIGFGDVTPSHPKFFLASSVYILFGLALVAMVIEVLMEFFKETIDKVEDIIPDVLMEDSDEEEEEKDIKAGLGAIAVNLHPPQEAKPETK